MTEPKYKIGITQGDPNGIGWEVIIKTLSDPRITEFFTPVLYGSPQAAAAYRNTLTEVEQFAPRPAADGSTSSPAARSPGSNPGNRPLKPAAPPSRRCARPCAT